MTAARKKKGPSEAQKARSLARMAAVQALYQMDLAGTDVSDVIAEFETLRFAKRKGAAADAGTDGENSLVGADPVFFAEILRGVIRRQRDIDPIVDQQLAAGWRLKRVDSILRAILRAGVFELMERPDVPARAVLNEYINVAHAFFDGDEPRVVNGVLDALARKLRPDDFAGVGT
jgi:N utilization substance protein B